MNKKILSIISGVALVSVATVGFSSWVIGVQQKETTSEVSVKVDTVINDTQYITAQLASDKIVVAEKAEHPRGDHEIIGATQDESDTGIGVDANALSFSFSQINVTLGDSVMSSASTTKVTGVKIELFENIEVTNDKDLFKNRGVGPWTYLAFNPVTLTLGSADSDLVASEEESTSGYKTYVLKEGNYSGSLLWGSFFGNSKLEATENKNPVQYYNSLVGQDEKISSLLDKSNFAYQELDQMKKDLEASENKLTFKLSLVYGN